MVHIHTFLQKVRRTLKSERGEANYFSTVVFIFIAVILLAFILGLPANEIVVPIIIMAYMAQGSLVEMTDLNALKTLLVENGWTWVTAICTMLFSLMHWPCSTTCMTIKKETQSLKWTVVAFLAPTLAGLVVCFLVASLSKLFL